jgi:hypothetical protein
VYHGRRHRNLGYEAIALGRNRHHESRRIGIVSQRAPYFAHRGVDRVIDTEEEVLAPDPFEDFLTSHEMPTPVDQQEQQVERNPFKLQWATAAAKLVCAPINLEFRKSADFLGHLEVASEPSIEAGRHSKEYSTLRHESYRKTTEVRHCDPVRLRRRWALGQPIRITTRQE